MEVHTIRVAFLCFRSDNSDLEQQLVAAVDTKALGQWNDVSVDVRRRVIAGVV